METQLFYYENSDSRIILTASACDDLDINPSNPARFPIIHAIFGKNDRFIYVYFEVIATDNSQIDEYIAMFAANVVNTYTLNKFIFKSNNKDEFFTVSLDNGKATISPFEGKQYKFHFF